MQKWMSNLLRESVTPEIAIAYLQEQLRSDVSSELTRVQTPTLVLQRRGDRFVPVTAARALAAEIPDARYVALEGNIGYVYFGETEHLAIIDDFLGNEEGAQTTAQAGPFRTVLFTDLVGHTQMMSRLGDEAGRVVLREHEDITRNVLKQHGGTEVKTMGDGFMASFGSVTKAVECAIALQQAIEERNSQLSTPNSQLTVRVGLNAGEPIEEDGDLFGSTVILASRVAAKAGAGEILIPEPLRHLLTGKSYVYADRGETMLKGFEDAVRLYEVRWTE
jgi:class 3 adenylate cyclase